MVDFDGYMDHTCPPSEAVPRRPADHQVPGRPSSVMQLACTTEGCTCRTVMSDAEAAAA